MVIVKPDILYVGKDEERKPTVAFEENKYEESDLYFYEQALSDAGVESDDTNMKENDETQEEDDLIKMLEGMQ